DGGWNISFRLHNASSKVEPSLKFDIQLVKTPINTGFHSIKIV
ncbi:HaeIII family restriction endonuclease, partial [Candidatus Liberibacter solanacearum]